MVKVNESVREEGPPSSLSVDESFVVLERSPSEEVNQFASFLSEQSTVYPTVSPHNTNTGGTTRMESQSLQNSSYVPGSLPTDLSPEEIQKRLHDVLQENLQLKETLQQNNLAMKQQFNTLARWQEEVFKVHQNHKAKFAETKELVLKLRAENTELKNTVQEYEKTGTSVPDASDTQLMRENLQLKGKIAELQQKLSTPVVRKEQHQGISPSKKEQEMSALLEQINRQLETAERARRQLTVDVERLTAQKSRLEREMLAQKSEMDEQKEQLQKSQREKEELEKKIRVLLEQVVAATVAEKDTQSPVNEQALLAHDLRDCEEMLEQISSCLDRESERFTSLDSWLKVVSDNINQWKEKQSVDGKTINTLKTEVQELRELLLQEKASNQEKKKNLEEAQEKFSSLYSAYGTVVNELQNFHEEQKNKDRHNNAYHEVQARSFTEKIDGMTAQIINLEEALAQKNKELKQLMENDKKLELENEAIAILKAQVEVYQSDFNAEREARENLAGEKERLAEDLRHLQRRNQQLLDELEAYQQNQFEQLRRTAIVPTVPVGGTGFNTIGTPGRVDTQRLGRSSPRRLSPGPHQEQQPLPAEQNDQPVRVYDDDIPPPKRYSCPVCNMEFAQVHLLQHHVERCLE